MIVARWVCTTVLALACLFGQGEAQDRTRFDHWQHRGLFPSCTSCHTAVEDHAQALWPQSSGCAACHDGVIEEKVTWRPPLSPPPTNLRFSHSTHSVAVRRRTRADSLLDCRSCHAEAGADRMQVRLAVAQNCLDCHGIRASHLEAPDSSCATCHVPLSRAVRLARSDVADFPAPQSHKAPSFLLADHGRLARGRANSVSAACATCHARDFCSECHVNAPEVASIQALAADSRSLAHHAELKAPPDHASPAFLQRHGSAAGNSAATCATCHTQESCMACHVGRQPRAALALPAAAKGRGKGAVITRERPASHGADFSELHGPVANARPETCNGCHVRPQCLDCHRPNPADATPGYHPSGFLGRHPAAAYTRETSCSDCHNTGQFCADCHVSAGLSAKARLDAGYHDAKRSFIFGHGQAARQNLESCVACHAERDCLACHSALTGRRFNPHGPGFDPATLQRKNSQACTACHGAQIPSSRP